MTAGFLLRRALAADARALARVHVDSRRQTYRGLVADAVLDDPGLLSSRERFWIGALTDERWSVNRIAVAEVDGVLPAEPAVLKVAEPNRRAQAFYRERGFAPTGCSRRESMKRGSPRGRGVLAGFDDSADLGGLPLPDGSSVPDRRVVRANTPPDLSPGDRTAPDARNIVAMLDRVRDVHGSSAGYLRSIGLDGEEVSALRRWVSP
ncbi:hypothetical protein OG218_07315 [Kineococcus sp. NBC_00420]|uniref:hypothetical protein n=1 Tax=Kineococcus sp. NBC_00420 TaxID=2903564 RepID=UPI002E1DBABD